MGISDEALGFVLVTGAGLATTFGAAIVLFPALASIANTKFLAFALALSAGVMLYVSAIEIFYKSRIAFEESSNVGGDRDGGAAYIYATLSFFGGIVISALLDVIVHRLDKGHSHHIDAEDVARVGSAPANPSDGDSDTLAGEIDVEMVEVRDHPAPNPPQTHAVAATGSSAGAVTGATTGSSNGAAAPRDSTPTAIQTAPSGVDLLHGHPGKADTALTKMGIMTAVALAIHNFPEGLATYVATLDDPSVGAALAVAIAVHNIPEGVCVAIPIYYATGSRMKGFLYAVLSGLSEPVGALLGWAVLGEDTDSLVYGLMFGIVAGIMVHICIHELLPTALRYDPQNAIVTKGVVLGFGIMAASLILFVA